MRIINFFEKEKKVESESNVEHINVDFHSVLLNIPCKVNLHYSSENKIIFNSDKNSFNCFIKNNILNIVVSTKSHQVIKSDDVLDLHINKKIKKLHVMNKTKLYSNDFTRFEVIEANENAHLEIQEISTKSISVISTQEAQIHFHLNKESMNEIELQSKGESLINIKNIISEKGILISTGQSKIEAQIAEHIDSDLQGMSQQYIYGEPAIVKRKNKNGLGIFKLIQN